MKVRDLIERLQQSDPESLVVMAKDSEGNDYSPLYDAWDGYYEADSTYSGMVYEGKVGETADPPEIDEMNDLLDDEEDEDDDDEDEDEDLASADAVACVVLCPTN